MKARSDALHARVRAFVDATMRGEHAEPFSAIALDLARFQADFVRPFARLVASRGVDLARVDRVEDVPALPADVFRLARVAAHEASEDAIVFRTSGTTHGARGEHPMRTTATYERAALAWGEAFLFPDHASMDLLLLAPPREESSDSSLGFMMRLFARRLGATERYGIRSNEIDLEAVERFASEATGPALVLGTSFAFVHLTDALGARTLPLPPGSRAMQTGGFKGRSRVVDASELSRAIARVFSMPIDHVVAEYGMTELSSQLYDATLVASLAGDRARPLVYRAPPWLEVSAVDPESLAPLSRGEVGLARFVDLANVDSVAFVLTQDRVRVTEDGVELLGRAPGAVPRGCSLAIDEALGAS